MRGKGIDWTAQPLGRTSDSEIARAVGCSQVAVTRARNRRGIPPIYTNRQRGIDWDAQPLGAVPDRVIAERLGVCGATVSKARRARGVETFRAAERKRRGA